MKKLTGTQREYVRVLLDGFSTMGNSLVVPMKYPTTYTGQLWVWLVVATLAEILYRGVYVPMEAEILNKMVLPEEVVRLLVKKGYVL